MSEAKEHVPLVPAEEVGFDVVTLPPLVLQRFWNGFSMLSSAECMPGIKFSVNMIQWLGEVLLSEASARWLPNSPWSVVFNIFWFFFKYG